MENVSTQNGHGGGFLVMGDADIAVQNSAGYQYMRSGDFDLLSPFNLLGIFLPFVLFVLAQCFPTFLLFLELITVL